MSTDQDKPQGKPGQRNRKAERRREKATQPQSPAPDRQPDTPAPIAATLTTPDAFASNAVVPVERSAVNAVAVADSVPVNLQTIASAYGDYTRKSLDDSRYLVQQLTTVRSLDQAIEIQSEFARHACETFLADSQKIWRLYNELARQIFWPLHGFLARASHTAR